MVAINLLEAYIMKSPGGPTHCLSCLHSRVGLIHEIYGASSQLGSGTCSPLEFTGSAFINGIRKVGDSRY